MSEFDNFEQQRQSADFFGDILSSLDDIDNGKPVKKSTRPHKGANETDNLLYSLEQQVIQDGIDKTTKLLQSLNEDLGYGNLNNESGYDYVLPEASVDSDDFSSIYDKYVPSENENFIPDESFNPEVYNSHASKTAPVNRPVQQQQQSYVAPNKPYAPGENWSIIEENVFGMKSAKSYSLKCNRTNQVLFDNIMLHESAIALQNVLNAGRSLTDPKVLGIISSGIQYTSVVKEALKAAKKRNDVLKESKYDEAKELDTIIAEHKQKANDLKYRVLNFLNEEGFNTK